jgi:hypothetical protein
MRRQRRVKAARIALPMPDAAQADLGRIAAGLGRGHVVDQRQQIPGTSVQRAHLARLSTRRLPPTFVPAVAHTPQLLNFAA